LHLSENQDVVRESKQISHFDQRIFDFGAFGTEKLGAQHWHGNCL